MRNLSYEKTLAKSVIKMLEDRRVRVDLIKMFKYVIGLDVINWERNPMINTMKARVLSRSIGV